MEFVAEYENRTNSEYDRVLAGVMFDVIWVLAMALNDTMTMINHGDISQTGCVNASGDLVPLEQFNYTNEKIGCLVQWNLQRTHFGGVSVSNAKQVSNNCALQVSYIVGFVSMKFLKFCNQCLFGL